MDAPQVRDLPELLTPDEVAVIFRVTAAGVRKWAREGKLPTVSTPGRRVRFRRSDVLALLEQGDVA